MTNTTLTCRTVLRTAAMLMTAAATAPFVRRANAVGNVVPCGKLVLA